MIKVVNKYSHDSTEHDFYIGRGSPLGNPFSSKESSKDYVEVVDSREEAISKFESWLRKEIREKNSKIVREFYRILKHEKKHGKVNLVCFCKPKDCHGDIIKKFLQKIKEENDRF